MSGKSLDFGTLKGALLLIRDFQLQVFFKRIDPRDAHIALTAALYMNREVGIRKLGMEPVEALEAEGRRLAELTIAEAGSPQ